MSTADPKIMVFHPDVLTRAELRAGLEGSPGIAFLRELSSLRSMPVAAGEGSLDILVMGLDRPAHEVAATVRKWLERFGLVRFVAVLGPGSLDGIRALAAAGVTGFVAEGAPIREVVSAIRTTWDDGAYLSLPLFRSLFSGEQSNRRQAGAFGLTAREREILLMISLGLSNKEIARRLDLSVRTVETHRFNIRRKTLARTRRDLLEVAQKIGLFSEYGDIQVPAERSGAPGFHEE